MDHDEIERLRTDHPAWSLLNARTAPLVLSFLARVFVDGNRSNVAASSLAAELDDELYALNQRLGNDAYPKAAASYLDDWASPDRGWLRKHYPPGSDEPHFDVTPAVEKSLTWIRDLRPREFIGTESRLNTIFVLLREMVYGSDSDPADRLADLRRQREGIDREIERAEAGNVEVLDEIGQRDRYQQFAKTARDLLSDFREVEENFRHLDRSLREQIASWGGSKGELLDDVLANRSTIADSDQGRSFQAFYDFLLSAERQAELSEMLSRLHEMDSVSELDPRLSQVHFDWIDASERTQVTVRMLSEQLRRFLDDQVWLENRRVIDLLRDIEAKALELRDVSTTSLTMKLDDTRVPVALPMERPMYRRTRAVPLDSERVEPGDPEFDASVLHDQAYVDHEVLVDQVLRSLGSRDQVGLDEVVSGRPLEHGLAELMAYLALNEPDLEVVFDDDGRARIGWTIDGADRVADLPLVTFSRHGE